MGIVSSSLLKNDGCDVSKNAVYTNVIKFSDWIGNIIGTKHFLKQHADLNICSQPQDFHKFLARVIEA